ncbi:MAG: hypothetical protein JNK82_39540, partial [Myxococcaceae bacterium]|nr:hypothetical protein [Myxococcaceae bacterium]
MSRPSFALVVAALVPVAAQAARLELLGPETTVSPDGFDVAVRLVNDQGQPADAKAATIEVEGGTAGPGRTDGLIRIFTITPADRAVKVKAAAGAATAGRTFAVGPPA